MTPLFIPDDWVRIQVYMPEEIRYKLRTCVSGKSDSDIVRKVLFAFLNLSESQRDSLLDED